MPCAMMQRQFGVDVIVRHQPKEKDFEGVDIVFFNRLIPSMPVSELLDLKKKYGFKIVCDLDDHWILDHSHILYHSYAANNISQKIHDCIVLADAVTVTHDRLYDEVVKFNENCHILPNAIERIEQFSVQKIHDECVRLFWAGGITHRKDLELLRRPLQLIKRYGVKLVMAGYEHNNPEWKEMAKIFTTDSAFNTMVIESQKVFNYYHVYSLCDVSLIPLVDNHFNRHKSNLKILEAANIGAPVIVSRVHPYLDFPEDLVNYVDAHSPWYKQINRMIKEPLLRKEQGEALRAYCNEHFNFQKINTERYQIFKSLLNESGEHRKATEVQAETSGVAQ